MIVMTKKQEAVETKEIIEAPIEVKVEEIPSAQIGSVIVPELPAEIPSSPVPESLINWVPKTSLGRDVFEGRINSIDEVIGSGRKVMEYQIIDKLVPGIKNELVLVGGRAGKGGGIQRIPVRITAAMKKSGRRFHTAALVVVGNEDGLVGMSQGRAVETREAIRKGIERAKVNIIKIRRGCGSWECGCGTPHSVPFKTIGKCGSVKVEMIPAPKGTGIVAENEAKKILKLAGIKDVWVKTFGNTSMRFNLISAIFEALKKSYNYDRGNE
jgi:small subunit ribosomal protein S5